LYIEQDEIWAIFRNLCDCVAAILAFADELHALDLAQQTPQALPGHRLVVDDEHSHIGGGHR